MTDLGISRLVADVFELPKWVRPREIVRASVEPRDLLREQGDDGPVICVERYMTDERGTPTGVGYRRAYATLPPTLLRAAQRSPRGVRYAVVDAVVSTLDYLTGIVCPAPRPKAWRLFNRRSRR